MDLFKLQKLPKKRGKKVRGIRKENRKYAIKKIEELGPRIKSTDCRPEGKKKGYPKYVLESKCGGGPERG